MDFKKEYEEFLEREYGYIKIMMDSYEEVLVGLSFKEQIERYKSCWRDALKRAHDNYALYTDQLRRANKIREEFDSFKRIDCCDKNMEAKVNLAIHKFPGDVASGKDWGLGNNLPDDFIDVSNLVPMGDIK